LSIAEQRAVGFILAWSLASLHTTHKKCGKVSHGHMIGCHSVISHNQVI